MFDVVHDDGLFGAGRHEDLHGVVARSSVTTFASLDGDVIRLAS